MRRTGRVECLNLLWVALVASGVGRGWAVVVVGRSWASCQAFEERRPSWDAFVAVAAFLAVNGEEEIKECS